MSFSGMVKEELSRHIGSGRHCRIAELAAIFTFCGSLEAGTDGDVYKRQVLSTTRGTPCS